MALDELEAATLEEVEDCAIALLVADEEALFSTGVIIIVGGLGGKLSGLPSYNATEEDEETIVEDEDDDTDSDDELAGVILMAGLFDGKLSGLPSYNATADEDKLELISATVSTLLFLKA